MIVSRRFFAAMVCITSLFFQTSFAQEPENTEPKSMSWAYYAHKGVVHTLGTVAMLYAGAMNCEHGNIEIKKARRNLAVMLGTLIHMYGFGAPFWLKEKEEKSQEDGVSKKESLWRGVGLSVASVGTHLLAEYCMFWAGHNFKNGWRTSSADKDNNLTRDVRKLFLKGLAQGLGGLFLHSLGWTANECGAQQINESRGMKVTVRTHGFDQEAEETLKNEMRKKRRPFDAYDQ